MRPELLMSLASVAVWAIDERKTAALALLAAGERVETPTERRAASQLRIDQGVAVIPVDGVLTPRHTLWGELFGGEAAIEDLRAMLRRAIDDPQVSSVLFVIDSPGGDVSGVPELAAEIRAARETKPVYAHVRYLAASGAYWLASACQEITGEPSSEVGSIGVYALHASFAKAFEEAGVEHTLIKAGENKAEWLPYFPLTDDAKAAEQVKVDEIYAMFLKDVAAGRGVSVAHVKADYGGGRTFLAKDAKALGMIDRVASLDETERKLRRQSGGRRADASEDAADTPVASLPDVAADVAAPVAEALPTASAPSGDEVQRDLDWLSL